MIALHNLLDSYRVAGWHGPGTPTPPLSEKLWILLHQAFSAFPVLGDNTPVIAVIYPLVPWIGVMAVGYVFGALYRAYPQPRRRLLLIIGASDTLLFVIHRSINIYGDPNKWTSGKNIVYTALSFVNTTKYPPSLLFLLMTLGPAIFALAVFVSAAP